MRKLGLALSLVIACGDAGDVSATDEPTSSSSSATLTSTSTTVSSTTAPSDTGGSSTAAESSTGSADESSSSTGEPIGTEGCGLPAVDATMQWAEHDIVVGSEMRQYFVWLPEPYDPMRAYPVVYQFHGCSDGDDRWTNNPPVQDESGPDAIHIRGKAVASCWDASPQGPDLTFFDALVTDVELTWCADAERRFATGYSGGSFMTHMLACARADKLRAVATIAGGQVGSDCTGQVAALLIHDADDQTVNISNSIAARDDHLARNHCDTAAPTMPIDPAPCEAYQGCDEGYPVVWCQTAGQDHSRQDELSAPAFWGFLSALP